MLTPFPAFYLLIALAARDLTSAADQTADIIRHIGTMTLTVYDYGPSDLSGDTVLLSSQDENLLMDTAYPDNMEDLSQCTLIRSLKEDGIRDLDLYLSHWHNDHYFLLTTIMSDPWFHVGKLYLPESSEELEYADPVNSGETWYRDLTRNISSAEPSWGPHSYSEVLDTAAAQDIESVWLDEGESFTVGDAHAEVLWHRKCNTPAGQTVVPYLNDRSLVTMVTCGGVRYLTCGDIHKANEYAILGAGVDVDADIFKANHHTFLTSNSQEWIDAVSPSVILSTRQVRDPDDEPNCEEQLAAVCPLWSAQRSGDVTVLVENGEITVTAEGKKDPPEASPEWIPEY